MTRPAKAQSMGFAMPACRNSGLFPRDMKCRCGLIGIKAHICGMVQAVCKPEDP